MSGVPIVGAPDEGPHFPLSLHEVAQVVRQALDEDEAFNDVTTIATVVSDRRARGVVAARESGVVCGTALAVEAFAQLDSHASFRIDAPDGTRVEGPAPVAFISGKARALLSAERVALNFMQRLSGVASLTRLFVDAIEGLPAEIYDTRKTTPGWRRLEKYAVRCGGGMNHRSTLAAQVLIKDNHLASLDGDVALAIRRSRALAPAGTLVEVECDRLEQVRLALDAGADIILLDNMTVSMLAECVRHVNGAAITEASGGVSLDTARAIAETGVNRISVGALTHSAPAMDLGLDFD